MAVRFGHKYLTGLRMRVPRGPDPREWEAILPNFAGQGTGSVAVMNWEHIPIYAGLDMRDQMLHEHITEIGRSRPLDPLTIRQAHLKIGAEYGVSSEERCASAQALTAETEERRALRRSFLAHVVRESCIKLGHDSFSSISARDIELALSRADGTPAELDPDFLMSKATQFLEDKHHILRESLDSKIDKLVDLLVPLGPVYVRDEKQYSGYVLRQFRRLLAFHKDLNDIQSSRDMGGGDIISVVLFGVREYVRYLSARVTAAQQLFIDFGILLADLDNSIRSIKRVRRDIVFAIDGWGMLIDRWDAAQEEPEGELRVMARREALVEILKYLPTFPAAEVITTTANQQIWRRYDHLRRNMVRLMHNWLDGNPDDELINRVQTARQREDAKRTSPKRWESGEMDF